MQGQFSIFIFKLIINSHFVNHTADGPGGLDVELIKRFADHLGVAYELVESSWPTIFSDLTGQLVSVSTIRPSVLLP